MSEQRRARPSPRAAAAASLLLGCSVGELDLSRKRCPCLDGWRCDDVTDTCLPATGDGSSRYAAEVLADEPLGYWRLGEPEGETIARAARGELDGECVGGFTFGVRGALAGDPDTAIDLRASAAAYIDVGNQFGFDQYVPYSVEAWVMPNVLDEEYRHVACKTRASVPGYEDGYELHAVEGAVAWQRLTQGTFSTGSSYAPALDIDAWSHVVGVFDGLVAQLYVNGAPQGAGPEATFPLVQTSAPFWWGACPDVGSFWDGRLDEVAIYGVALEPKRIEAHYLAGRGE